MATTREWIGVGVLAAITLLGFARSGALLPLVEEARASRNAIRSDDDFYRAMAVLGPEYPILQALRREHAPGTPVSVRSHGESVARGQRFWLALLPDYPIRTGADLLICPRPCAAEEDVLLARGRSFELLDRSARR